MKDDRRSIGIGVIGIRSRISLLVVFTYNPRFGIVLHAVCNTKQIAGKPAVHHRYGWRSAVPVLVVIYLSRQSFGPRGFVDSQTVFGNHIPVVKTVRHQQGCFHFIHLIQIVAPCPKVVVVAGNTVLPVFHLCIAHGFPGIFAFRLIAAVNKVEQNIHIFSQVPAGRANQPVGAVIVVIRSIGRHRNNGFQTFHAGCCSSQRQRSVVRRARHSHFSGRPVGFYLFASGTAGVTFCPTTKPIDHRLWRQRFIVAANRRNTVRQTCSGRGRVHHNVATRQPGTNMPFRNDRAHPPSLNFRRVCVWFRLFAQLLPHIPKIGRIVSGRSGKVRTGIVNNRQLQTLSFGFGRTGYVNVHPVRTSVAIAVEFGFHPQIFPDPAVRIFKSFNNLRFPVFKPGLRFLFLLGLYPCNNSTLQYQCSCDA